MIFDLVLNTICNVSIISIDNNSFNQFQKRKTQSKLELDRGERAINYHYGGSSVNQTGRGKIQVRVEATRDLNRVDVALHQSAEEGGEDDLYQLLDQGGGALRSRENDFMRLILVDIFVD